MPDKAQILLIEDDPVQQIVLSRFLEPYYSVQSQSTVQAATQSLDNPDFTPDLILCDMYLPDGSGLELRKTIYNHDTLRSCPFIFLSGSLDEKMRSDAAVLGIDDFLSKPIRSDALLSAVERVLTRARQLREAHAQHLDQQITDPLHPDVPDQIGPYELRLRYNEMTAGGGDFVFHIPGHKCDYILFGDVVGHGAPAKFFLHAYTGYLYGLTRALRHRDLDADAGQLMTLLNNEVAADPFLKRWLFTCMALCLPHDGPITLANGGHPPAWLVGRHRMASVDVRGPMPGLMAHVTYENNIVDLKKGDRLYIASDGTNLTRDMLRNLHSLTTSQAAHQAITAGRDQNHPDDATILIISKPDALI
jgi:sigma-B regulation protein RsbU (phosphoserine phosphatase)